MKIKVCNNPLNLEKVPTQRLLSRGSQSESQGTNKKMAQSIIQDYKAYQSEARIGERGSHVGAVFRW